MKKVAVLGGGNGGYACSADLSLAGHQVNLYELPQFRSGIEPVMQRGGIEITGAAREGFARIKMVTTNIKEAVEGVDLVLIVVPAFAHKSFIEECMPNLENGQNIVFMGKGGGTLEFAKIMKDRGIRKNVTLGETCTLPYTARIIGPAQVKIFAKVKKLPMSAFPAGDTGKLVKFMQDIYPVTAATNVLETFLLDLNTVVHPAPVILNAARIESKADFALYAEGVTPAVAGVVEAIDAERLAVMKALGLKPLPFTELVYMVGLAAGKCNSIYEEFTTPNGIIGARELKAPTSLQARHITEDIPYGLVPLAAIAKIAGIPTSVINSLITIASTLNQVDYVKEGRNAQRLGISKMNIKDLKNYVTTGKT
jgi:opine dehydrogenase